MGIEDIPYKENIKLSDFSRWKVGGIASKIFYPSSQDHVISLMEHFSVNGKDFAVVGSTSNILFSDEGLEIPCIKIGENLSGISIDGGIVTVEAGIFVPKFARLLFLNGFCGFEHIVGIPGTLGGLIYMNGGSQRKAISEYLLSVKALKPNGEIRIYSKSECAFSYRDSIFRSNDHVILSARFEFPKANDRTQQMREIMDIYSSRRKKFPQKYPNCGSTFVSNPKMYNQIGPPGKVIESYGFKGYRIGGAEVSTMHANFINNIGNAKSSDILKIVNMIIEKIQSETGFTLLAEGIYFSGKGEKMNLGEAGKTICITD